MRNIVAIGQITIMKLLTVLIGPKRQLNFRFIDTSKNRVFRSDEFFEESLISENQQNFPEDVRLLPFSSNPSKREHLELQVHSEDLVLLFVLLKVDDFDFSSVLYHHVIFLADEDHLSPNHV